MNATEINRLVKGGSREGRLFVAEHEGQLYATNSYWLVPVAKVAPLLAKYNLPVDVPGSYQANGTVTPTGIDPPNLAPLMPRNKDLVVLEQATLAGDSMGRSFSRPAFVQVGDGFAEVWRNGDEMVAINATFADLVRDSRNGEPVMMQWPGETGRPVSAWVGDVMVGLVMPVRIS